MSTPLPTAPGALLGYTKSGRPIRVIAGAAEDPEPDNGGGQDPTTEPEPTQGTTPEPGAGTSPPAGDPSTDDVDMDSLPEATQKRLRTLEAELQRARNDATKARTNAKKAAADEARQQLAQEIGKALGLVESEDDKADPAKLAEQITAKEKENREARIENAVLRRAAGLGADGDKLLDSKAFERVLAAHVEAAPGEDGFAEQVEAAIKEAVDKHPEYKLAKPATPDTSGPDFSGGSGAPPKRQTIDDLRKARQERRKT